VAPSSLDALLGGSSSEETPTLPDSDE